MGISAQVLNIISIMIIQIILNCICRLQWFHSEDFNTHLLIEVLLLHKLVYTIFRRRHQSMLDKILDDRECTRFLHTI